MGVAYRLRNVRLEPGGPVRDVCLRDGHLEDLTPSTPGADVEGTGHLLMPGMVDPHAHLRVPGMEAAEDWDTGSRAALRGGVTSVFDMPNTRPPTTWRARLDEKRTLAAASRVAWGLHLGATASNADEFADAGNIASVKVYMGSSTGDLLVDGGQDLERVFRSAARAGVPVSVHAEDEGVIRGRMQRLRGDEDVSVHGWVRPPEAAAAAVARALDLAARAGAMLYVCHVSTAAELQLLRAAKLSGQPVVVEATPHHLLLGEEDLPRLGNYGKVNPPLRGPSDRAALWEAVRDGTVDCIGTDHAPHPREAKERPYLEAPSGMPGLETALPLLITAMLTGRLSFERLVALTSARAHGVFGVEPAGWVLVDLDAEKELQPDAIQSRCGWSPYVGWPLCGWPQKVWACGILAYDGGGFGPTGTGTELLFRRAGGGR